MATYVLVHGVYQGGWIWKPVAERLRAAGHTVYAPTLDGCGERHNQLRVGITLDSQAREIADFLFYEDLEEVVLVGTSAGGMVICRAAELARERIGRLAFVDALALLPGETIAEVTNSKPVGTPTTLTVGPTTPAEAKRLGVFAELDAEKEAWATERYTPHPIEVVKAPMELEDFWEQSWSATVLYCQYTPNPPREHQRRTAEKLNASWHELEAGHFAMLSHPDEVAKFLL